MDVLPPSTKTLSLRSSSDSIAESVLKTPVDVEQPSPPNSCFPTKTTLNMASRRIEMLSKRSNTLPTHLRHPSHPTHPRIHPQNLRPRADSTASIASTNSQVSLLRATLKMVTSPHSSRNEAGTDGSAPSLLTSRSSSFSFASTSLSNPISIPPCVKDGLSPLVLAAEATTALSPSTGTSLAQFSPTPRASSSLLRFGVSNARSKSVASETRRSLGRVCSGGGDDSDRFLTQGENTRRNSLWFTSTKSQDLPSISRALEPDEQIYPVGLPMPHSTRSTLNLPAPQATSRVIAPDQPLLGTPRPDDGIKLSFVETVKSLDQNVITITSKGKGKERVVPPEGPLSSRLSTPSGPKGNLPTLEAIESGSRLMRSKIVCSTCGEVGPDFPQCRRCSEAWCSRDCRLHANMKTGGKHHCASSVA